MASAEDSLEAGPQGQRAEAPACVVVGMISRSEDLFENASTRLSRELGPRASICEIFPFTFTEYYNAEMGTGLLRTFVAFQRLLGEGELRRLKGLTAAIEREFFYNGTERRSVNLDPGVLTDGHLVLASHKRASHRVYLGGGVYAELELLYTEGCYRPLPWTYPDYRTEVVLCFFRDIRSRLLRGPA